jgi:hypothetical protein
MPCAPSIQRVNGLYAICSIGTRGKRSYHVPNPPPPLKFGARNRFSRRRGEAERFQCSKNRCLTPNFFGGRRNKRSFDFAAEALADPPDG